VTDTARAALTAFAGRCSERLAQHFARWRADVPAALNPPTPADLYDAVTALTLRPAKRLRPALAYHAALCIEAELDPRVLLDACLALELLQTALLVHDDIMDRDDERRGGPAVHASMARATSDPHLGDALGILGGSLALALAQRLLCEAGLPPAATASAALDLARMQTDVIYGQHLDLIGGAPAPRVQDLKTTSYTTRGPVRFGARLAGGSPASLAALEAYATPLGRAFQTRDDLLGVFGDPRRLGKPVGADLREGRRTELVALALERADDAQAAALHVALGNPAATPAALDAACAAIEATGARRELEALIQRKTSEAVAALEGAALRDEGRQFLRGIATLLAERVA
jgi:geranylgeranyl diphosphate synthase, type I